MQASQALGIHRNTLQKYTDCGFIKCGFRKSSKQKFYLGSEIMRFWRAQS
jgi:predicted site-specific integrase-resolvase